ncbi:MAG: 4Fe-4S dicluster domain-containing protein [Proteobacteria bacterium]|nr:4Fe-4S dicluster domain-containing protein [Pseudomonadota bacterium]
MSGPEPRPDTELSVSIRERRCSGCVVCMHACPSKAIRLRRGKAVILPELCVDCGECMRACPNRAIVPRVSTYQDTARFKVTALLPSPVIYTQFGEDVPPNDILLALGKLGFDYVFDLARYCEWGNLAMAEWLARNPRVRTAFSSICPVFMNLIARRFPDLIQNVVPLVPPREFGAKHIRRLLQRKLGLADEDIGVFYVTPCSAKIVAINRPSTLEKSYLSGALGLHDMFGDILRALKNLTEEDRETLLFNSGGFGINWEMAGGEIGGLSPADRVLAVNGMHETLEVLDQIESGRLSAVRYFECRTCPHGCLGGPLTVENPYMARATLRKLMRMFGTLPRVQPKDIASLIDSPFFGIEKEMVPDTPRLDDDPLEAIKKLKRMDELTNRLPGKRCGICGAPDCRTLAEDVVLGKASLSACPFLSGRDPEERKTP